MLTLIMGWFQDFIYILKIHQNKKHKKNKKNLKQKKTLKVNEIEKTHIF